jgi:hypothetical protein
MFCPGGCKHRGVGLLHPWSDRGFVAQLGELVGGRTRVVGEHVEQAGEVAEPALRFIASTVGTVGVPEPEDVRGDDAVAFGQLGARGAPVRPRRDTGS